MTRETRENRGARAGRRGGAVGAGPATLGLVLVVVAVFVLNGMVPADSSVGSVLRTAEGGLLAGLTLAWATCLRRSLRRRRRR
ncbi:hypothetical protein ACIRRH_13395 [Kitasatospora sp. NPDC101235]|uniref:hypothetical protein n=1 Tax=Kitasatospora sp. NPDC101235 TaxID=3364101 RepID=UPI003823F711